MYLFQLIGFWTVFSSAANINFPINKPQWLKELEMQLCLSTQATDAYKAKNSPELQYVRAFFLILSFKRTELPSFFNSRHSCPFSAAHTLIVSHPSFPTYLWMGLDITFWSFLTHCFMPPRWWIRGQGHHHRTQGWSRTRAIQLAESVWGIGLSSNVEHAQATLAWGTGPQPTVALEALTMALAKLFSA